MTTALVQFPIYSLLPCAYYNSLNWLDYKVRLDHNDIYGYVDREAYEKPRLDCKGDVDREVHE